MDQFYSILGESLKRLQFINNFFESKVMDVSDGLISCTSKPRHCVIPDSLHPPNDTLDGRRVIIVDTPGFSDTHKNERQVLEDVSVWLARS
jgi:hypothetical protein